MINKTYIPELPPQISLQYLAEGAANIVYRFSIPPTSPSISADITPDDDNGSETTTPPPSEIDALRYDPVFNDKLLRLRKGLASTVSNEESFKRFQDVIRPLFPVENLVEQALVRLPSCLVANCNRKLHSQEKSGARPRHRHGIYLAENESYGTLITDMSPNSDVGEILVEFKPKWLAQSPSAPPGSTRCRTCALRAMKNAQRGNGAEDTSLSFCPLDLVSQDRSRVERAVTAICLSLKKDSQLYESEPRIRLADFVYENPLLRRLKQLQLDLDRVGILEADVTSRDFLTAMTLRDCTLFVKVGKCGICSGLADGRRLDTIS